MQLATVRVQGMRGGGEAQGKRARDILMSTREAAQKMENGRRVRVRVEQLFSEGNPVAFVPSLVLHSSFDSKMGSKGENE